MGNVKVGNNSKYQLQTHPKQSVWGWVWYKSWDTDKIYYDRCTLSCHILSFKKGEQKITLLNEVCARVSAYGGCAIFLVTVIL